MKTQLKISIGIGIVVLLLGAACEMSEEAMGIFVLVVIGLIVLINK